MSYNGIYLNLLPVCQCGEILRDAYMCKQVGEVSKGMSFQTVEINPACCPFCGETIKGFQIADTYWEMFRGVKDD